MKTIVSDITNHKDFLQGKWTLEIGYPWLSLGAIIAMEGIVDKRLRVLEVGCGGSTIFWAKNCKNVKSFETNEEWYKKVAQKVRRFRNVELGLANEKQILKAIAKEPDKHYDIVLVNANPKEARRLLIANAITPKVKTGGWLVINNYNKFGMEGFNYPKSEILTFDGLKYAGRGTRLCKILA